MNQIEAVRKMQEYIENHLQEKISMDDLSKVSFYSPCIPIDFLFLY